MAPDRFDSLFEDDGLGDIRDLMGSKDELGITGMEWNPGGFIETRDVRATEPWRPSLVRLGERPRVQPSATTRKCDHCGTTYKAARSTARYCGPTCRQAAGRARCRNCGRKATLYNDGRCGQCQSMGPNIRT